MKTNVMKYLSLGILSACSSVAPRGPVVPTTDEAVCEAAEIDGDSALGRYAPCSSIAGDLVLRGVSHVSALANVRSITGSLWIRDTTDLASLSGLERLESVPLLMLTRNRNLTDVSALSRLREVGSLVLARNLKLQSLQGLSGLSALDHLTVVYSELASLDGLDGLRRVGYLTILRNHDLRDIGALDHVTEADHVEIAQNPRISPQAGLLRGLLPAHPEISFRAGEAP
jgi:hypothetical protein